MSGIGPYSGERFDVVPLVLAVVRSCRIPQRSTGRSERFPPASRRALRPASVGHPAAPVGSAARCLRARPRDCEIDPQGLAHQFAGRLARSLGLDLQGGHAPPASALWWRARRGGYSASGSSVHSPRTTRRTCRCGSPCGGGIGQRAGNGAAGWPARGLPAKDGPCANRRRARSCSHSLGDLPAGAPRVPADRRTARARHPLPGSSGASGAARAAEPFKRARAMEGWILRGRRVSNRSITQQTCLMPQCRSANVVHGAPPTARNALHAATAGAAA